jgi:hypothetical protein
MLEKPYRQSVPQGRSQKCSSSSLYRYYSVLNLKGSIATATERVPMNYWVKDGIRTTWAIERRFSVKDRRVTANKVGHGFHVHILLVDSSFNLA